MSNQFIQMKKKGKKLFPKTLLIGIDTSNVLASNPPSPYIATEDCALYIYAQTRGDNYVKEVLVDGVRVYYLNNGNSNWVYTTNVVFIKKGQVITKQRDETIIFYGLKYI